MILGHAHRRLRSGYRRCTSDQGESCRGRGRGRDRGRGRRVVVVVVVVVVVTTGVTTGVEFSDGVDVERGIVAVGGRAVGGATEGDAPDDATDDAVAARVRARF